MLIKPFICLQNLSCGWISKLHLVIIQFSRSSYTPFRDVCRSLSKRARACPLRKIGRATSTNRKSSVDWSQSLLNKAAVLTRVRIATVSDRPVGRALVLLVVHSRSATRCPKSGQAAAAPARTRRRGARQRALRTNFGARREARLRAPARLSHPQRASLPSWRRAAGMLAAHACGEGVDAFAARKISPSAHVEL